MKEPSLEHRIVWNQFVLLVPLTPADLVKVTVEWDAFSQEDLARHLDTRFPGILERLCRRYVEHTAFPMIREVLPPVAEVIICNLPKSCDTEDADEARGIVCQRFIQYINANSPEHMKRAMMACVELGLGEFVEASDNAGFAACLRENPAFDEWMELSDHRATELLIRVEYAKATILVNLIEEARRNVASAATLGL